MTGIKHVYLLESECGRIKIGSSVDPYQRLLIFSNNSPRPVRLIAMWPGSQSDEMRLHREFIDCRTHNEWFNPLGRFGHFVEAMRGRGVPYIPPWEALVWTSINQRRIARKSASGKATRSDLKWKAEQAATRIWRKIVRAHEAALGREMTISERAEFIAKHYPQRADA